MAQPEAPAAEPRPGVDTILLTPLGTVDEWGAVVGPLARAAGRSALVARGTARAGRRLRAEAPSILVATPETALALLGHTALKIEALKAIVLAWPEAYEGEEALAALMADLPKDAQRIVYTCAVSRGNAVVERYIRKALTVDIIGADSGAHPTSGPVRTVSVAWGLRARAVSDLLETQDPASMAIWTFSPASASALSAEIVIDSDAVRVVSGDAPTADVVVSYDLPTAGRLRQLTAAGRVVLLVPPIASAYVSQLATSRPLRLPGLVEAVNHAAAQRRAAIVREIETGSPERAVITLAPLLDRYDPTAVAAALHELWTKAAGAEAPAPTPDVPATAKVWVGIGKKDGATPHDLVAALTKDLRVDRVKIGKVDLREMYSLIELPAQDVERVARELNGTVIRRRRVSARVDRGRPTRTAKGGRT